jgi:transcription-repair coupling factor (superfamily II helicase)
MLEQEISKLRGQEIPETELSFDQGGFIPPFYIPQDAVRVTLYRRVLKARETEEILSLRVEMEDRFGPLPEPARYLLDLTLLRARGARGGLRSVAVTRHGTKVKGDLNALSPFLRGQKGWTLLSDSALGPGGPAGARALAEALINLSGQTAEANTMDPGRRR